MKRFHYAWVICAACTLLQFSVSGLLTDSFTVFQPYILSLNGFSNTQLSVLIEIRTAVAFLTLFAVTAYYNRLGLRRGIVISLVTCAAAFLLYAFAGSFAGYCAAFAAAGAAYTLAGTVPASILIMRWFRDRSGLAMGIMASGTGICNIIGSPVFTKLIIATSIKTAFLVQCGFVLIVGLVMFFIVKTPEEMNAQPYEKPGGETKAVTRGSYSLPRAHLWLMLAAIVFLGGYINTGYGYLTNMYSTEGYDSMLIAYGISFIGAALILGKCLYGVVYDRVGAYAANYAFYGASAAGLALCCFSGGGAARMFASMLFLGLGFSMVSVSLPIWAADLSESRDYPEVLKKFQMANMAGGLIFNMLPGPVADRCGSYIPVYIIFTVVCLLSAAAVQTVYARRRAKIKANSLQK